MPSYFLSYAREDHFFAALASIELERLGVRVWRDQGSLRPGVDWQNEIENGITQSAGVLVALSRDACSSHYVTYEWAYAMGKGKPIVPLKISECQPHPKIARIQHVDFSVPGVLPWESLVTRLNEIDSEAPADAPPAPLKMAVASTEGADHDASIPRILAYLTQRGFRMASFERLRGNIGLALSDEDFQRLIERNPSIFRNARIKGGKSGLAYIGS